MRDKSSSSRLAKSIYRVKSFDRNIFRLSGTCFSSRAHVSSLSPMVCTLPEHIPPPILANLKGQSQSSEQRLGAPVYRRTDCAQRCRWVGVAAHRGGFSRSAPLAAGDKGNMPPHRGYADVGRKARV